MDGLWDDIIKLSTKEVSLAATGGSATITTEGESWWVYGASLDDDIYYYDAVELDLSSAPYTLDEDQFSIERSDLTTIVVSMDANTTGAERTLIVYLEAGDYFDSIKVTQAAN
ncbi:BACON domain-containing protein [Mangrovibacterium diazotrophicum]|uniref:BACON domain-containing protein n=1 Tax=Mangrovibacterium diazotrophicum TaxID=1261403 RepID=UPI001473365A|nr:BACON domain-containing protein [Mangrovibacterium diazotrophicum]